jgi:hypothetical protein
LQPLYLLLTVLVELPIHLLWLRPRPWLHITLVCLLLNGLTHPLANAAILSLGWNYWLVEALVVLVEGAVLHAGWQLGWKAWVLALLANAASVAVGWWVVTALS